MACGTVSLSEQRFVTSEMDSGVSLHSSNPELLMSALGQKRTSRLVEGMSALPSIADIGAVACRRLLRPSKARK